MPTPGRVPRRPPFRSEPPPRREAPEWQAPPPRQPRTTYRPDGYPPDAHRNESVAADPLVGTPPPPRAGAASPPPPKSAPPPPKKLTVTRVAAYRGRQLSQQAVNAFRRAAHADGAHESGLTSLTYAVMLNYASSAAMAVGLANTLFFSAATAESKTKVALYLLITVAPFALIAPVVGPMLDR
ncbi:MAG TPA: MFS transporter, partial [Pseudonocardiaceae bacterium]|nr:MFS transporter [Pseudonocardiaceae bacterium]